MTSTADLRREVEGLRAKKPADKPSPKFKVAVDLNDTITKSPADFDRFMKTLQAAGDEVWVVTGTQSAAKVLRKLGVTHFDGIEVLPPNHLPKDKAKWLKDHHFDMLVDDKDANIKAAQDAGIPLTLEARRANLFEMHLAYRNKYGHPAPTSRPPTSSSPTRPTPPTPLARNRRRATGTTQRVAETRRAFFEGATPGEVAIWSGTTRSAV